MDTARKIAQEFLSRSEPKHAGLARKIWFVGSEFAYKGRLHHAKAFVRLEKFDTTDPVNRVIAEVLCEEGVCEDPDNLWDAFYCPPQTKPIVLFQVTTPSSQ
jgi:hypothetical protein